MRIRNILFERFRGFEKLNISFPADANQIVFIGENGSGKSSLLEGISMILQSTFVSSHEYGGVNWSNPLNVKHPYKQGSIKIELRGQEQLFSFIENLSASSKQVFVDNYPEVDEGKSIDSNNFNTLISEDASKLYYSGIKDQIVLDQALDLWTPVILHYTAWQSSVESYKDALPMAFKIPMTTDFDMISDWFTEHENDENRKRLRVNADYRSVELETIRKVIIDGLTKLSGENGIVFSDLRTEIEETVKDGQVGSWLSIQKGTERLHVNQLSDGEKRVLILLADIARRLITAAKINKSTDYLAGTGIVLIDEIEQHLHPKWQRTLMPTLGYLFPNVQFVVTTHSPLVISNLVVPNESSNLSDAQSRAAVFRLTPHAATPIQSSGRDIGNVLGEYFDVERRSMFYQEKIDAFFMALEDETINMDNLKKQLLELKELLGESDPDVKSGELILSGLVES